MSFYRLALAIADRPITVLASGAIALVAFLLAPTIDRTIPILHDVEAGLGIWIDKDRLGWSLGVCRSRNGPVFTGLQFDIYPADGTGPYPLRGVMDIDAEVYAGADPIQLRKGTCRTYHYGVSVTGQAVAGDIIVGTAAYRSGVGWWTLYAQYGSVTVPAPPVVLRGQEAVVQRQLEAQGMGLERLK